MHDSRLRGQISQGHQWWLRSKQFQNERVKFNHPFKELLPKSGFGLLNNHKGGWEISEGVRDNEGGLDKIIYREEVIFSLHTVTDYIQQQSSLNILVVRIHMGIVRFLKIVLLIRDRTFIMCVLICILEKECWIFVMDFWHYFYIESAALLMFFI